MPAIKNHFTSTLIDWFSKAKRSLPWRETTDPYKIWLSEIILQQTRVDQGLPYYEKFIESHPNVHSLAAASEQNVLKLWEGLGYYSRARNLHAAAKHISQNLRGEFPKTYDEILKLKGVGPYTAAAISSIVFKEPKPVVDGNVYRFASRYFGVWEDISKTSTRKYFEKLLAEFISADQPGEFNQAMMEYGATVCTPAPRCESCVFRAGCFAYKEKAQSKLPVKSQKVKVKEENINYAIFNFDDLFLLQSRKQGIWKGLFQFHMVAEGTDRKIFKGKLIHQSQPIKHILTHRKLQITFYHFEVESKEALIDLAKELDLEVFTHKEMLNLPKPIVIVNYLAEINQFDKK